MNDINLVTDIIGMFISRLRY